MDSPIYRIAHTTGAVIGNRPVGWIRGVEDPSVSASQKRPQLGLALIRLAECAAAIAEGDTLWVDPSGSAKAAAVIEKERLAATVRPFAPAWWPKDIAPGIPRVDESRMRWWRGQGENCNNLTARAFCSLSYYCYVIWKLI